MRFLIFTSILVLLTACQPKQEKEQHTEQEKLGSLTIEVKRAKYAVPFCEKTNCIELNIQTLQTQDTWMNQWIEKQQSKVIQAQIDLKKNLNLQQAIDAYVKKSDAWQGDFLGNHAYQLDLRTRIASQRQQYILLQLTTNTKQAEVEVKDRQYFAVADRKLQKTLSVLDIIQPTQQQFLDGLIQEKYQQWLTQQSVEAIKNAPKKLYWGQADWFFDGEGVGLHYRTNEIVDQGQQLDIYLNHQQTQQVLQINIFQAMFDVKHS